MEGITQYLNNTPVVDKYILCKNVSTYMNLLVGSNVKQITEKNKRNRLLKLMTNYKKDNTLYNVYNVLYRDISMSIKKTGEYKLLEDIRFKEEELTQTEDEPEDEDDFKFEFEDSASILFREVEAPKPYIQMQKKDINLNDIGNVFLCGTKEVKKQGIDKINESECYNVNPASIKHKDSFHALKEVEDILTFKDKIGLVTEKGTYD